MWLFCYSDARVAWVRLLPEVRSPVLLESACHDGPTTARAQAASLSVLWSSCMRSLQCWASFHSCHGVRVWRQSLRSLLVRSQGHGVSILCVPGKYSQSFVPVYLRETTDYKIRKQPQSFICVCIFCRDYGIYKIRKQPQSLVGLQPILNYIT